MSDKDWKRTLEYTKLCIHTLKQHGISARKKIYWYDRARGLYIQTLDEKRNVKLEYASGIHTTYNTMRAWLAEITEYIIKQEETLCQP